MVHYTIHYVIYWCHLLMTGGIDYHKYLETEMSLRNKKPRFLAMAHDFHARFPIHGLETCGYHHPGELHIDAELKYQLRWT